MEAAAAGQQQWAAGQQQRAAGQQHWAAGQLSAGQTKEKRMGL
jgi:hypothetical protein